MNKILCILIIAVLLFPALFVIANPTYDFEDVRNRSQGIDYYSIFDSSRIGVPLERPISYSLMDYTPTYYNWFDITSEYTSFPTLGDPIGSGNSTVQPGEIPLVPMNTDIRYDNVLASFSAERNDLATYILYHDSAYIYSVIITHSLYDMTKVYAFESDPMDNAILIVDIVRGSGVDSPGLVHVDCRADFHDVIFTTAGNADLFFYRMNVDGNTARYMIFMENVGTENIILIKAGAKVYTGDMASPYPTPSWFDVFGAQGATVTYNESYVPGTIPAMPTIPTVPTYNGTTRVVNWALGELITPATYSNWTNSNVTDVSTPSPHKLIDVTGEPDRSTTNEKFNLVFSAESNGTITFWFISGSMILPVGSDSYSFGTNTVAIPSGVWLVRYSTTTQITGVYVDYSKLFPAVYNTTGDYKTIQSAINASTAGDIVQVMDGTYNEVVAINKQIKLIGNSKENVIVHYIYNLEQCTIENLTIKLQSSANIQLGLYTSAFVNNVIIERGSFGFWGITLMTSNSIIVLDNVVLDNTGGYYNVYLSGTRTNNTVYIVDCDFKSGRASIISTPNSKYYITNSSIISYANVDGNNGALVSRNNAEYYVYNSIINGLTNAYFVDTGKVIHSNNTVNGVELINSTLTADTITASTITLSGTASLTADSVVATTVTVAPTATLNVGWVVKPSGAMPVDRSTVQAVHDELYLPAILDGASSIPGGTEYSFTITEMETLGVYNPAMQVLYHGFPMDITAITDLKSHDQLQTIIYHNGGFMCYEGGEWVITYNVTGADRTAWESRQGFTLMGFSANKTGDMIEFYVSYVAGELIANQIQFKDSNTYNVFTPNYGMSMLNSPVTGIGTTLWYNWWASPTPGNIVLRGYDGSGHYNLDRNYTIDWYFGVAHTVYFTDAIMPNIDGVLYASDLRFAGQPAHLFNVFVTQKDIIYQKSGTNVTIDNTHITYRTGEHTTYVKNSNFTSYTVTASNLTTMTATHGGDIPMGFLTVTESYMFYSDNTFMVFTQEGVLIRAAQLPGVTVAVTEDSALVFEGNYRYLTVKYGDAYLINFGKSLTLIAPNGTVTIYHFTEAFSINTIRVFDGVNASGFYINGVIYLETEFVGGGDLYISTLYDFGYTLYDTSATEFFDTSYLKLSGSLISSAVSNFPISDFSALYLVIGNFSSGRFTVTVGDVQLECRRDGLNYRFIVDGNEIFIRTSNQAFVVSLVREYEQYTMTVTQVRIVGTSYEQLSPSSTLTWADTDDAQASSVVIAYSSADARIYDILVKTASMSVSLPDRMMTNQSNIVTGDGLSMGIEYWEIGTSMTLGDWVITRVSAYNLAVTYTPDNVTRTVAYRDAFSAIWDDGLTVNDVTLFENTSIPASLDVSGYVRYSAVSGVDVTVTSEKVLRAGDLSFDLQEYALYVLILAIMSASAVAYISRRYGFAWMDMVEFYGATLFLILGAMAVLGVA